MFCPLSNPLQSSSRPLLPLSTTMPSASLVAFSVDGHGFSVQTDSDLQPSVLGGCSPTYNKGIFSNCPITNLLIEGRGVYYGSCNMDRLTASLPCSP